MSQTMARDIDQEVLWDMLVKLGWTRVMLGRLQDNMHAVDITFWLKDHVKNHYKRRGRDFIFENHKDATLFILTWL
jgi:hypothetical protein